MEVELKKSGFNCFEVVFEGFAEHEETLGHLVRHVLVHEIGHHFGLSDDDMADIEAEAETE